MDEIPADGWTTCLISDPLQRWRVQSRRLRTSHSIPLPVRGLSFRQQLVEDHLRVTRDGSRTRESQRCSIEWGEVFDHGDQDNRVRRIEVVARKSIARVSYAFPRIFGLSRSAPLMPYTGSLVSSTRLRTASNIRPLLSSPCSR